MLKWAIKHYPSHRSAKAMEATYQLPSIDLSRGICLSRRRNYDVGCALDGGQGTVESILKRPFLAITSQVDLKDKTW